MGAIGTQGTELYWSTSTAYSTASSNLVGQVTNISGPGGEAAEIDVSHLKSTAKEYLMGLPDEGNVTFSCLYDTTDVSHKALQADRLTRTVRGCVIKLATTALEVIKFQAYCRGFAYDLATENAVRANVTLRVTGQVSQTTAL